MVNPIVTVNISLTQPPAPSNLQKTGALVSQGGTILGAQNKSLLTQLSDLTPLLAAPLNLTSLSWASTYGGQVTATASAAHGVTVGEQFVTTIAGAVPAAYNGTVLAMATGSTTFTYSLSTNPGTSPATTAGTYTPRGVGDLVAMATSFFGQGAQQSVYVFESGAGEASVGIANLQAYIAAQPSQVFYAYLVPRSWDATSQFLSLIAQYEATNAQTYFFTTTNLQNFTVYTGTMKCVVAMVESPAYGKWSTDTVTAGSWSGGEVTLTTTSAHGVAPGQFFTVTGINPSAYNGTFMALPGTTGTSLIYALASDPGAYVSSGALVQSLYGNAGIPATEFSLATFFQYVLGQSPTAAIKVPPFAFTELFGVTAFPVQGNGPILATLAAANVSYVGNGNEGGLSNNLLFKGHTKDGNSFNFWYEIDWFSINVSLNLANAVINGNNNKSNPLYNNQDGINRLEQVVFNTAQTGISYGLFLGTPKQYQYSPDVFNAKFNDGDFAGQLAINAIPFATYNTLNPNDYRNKTYGGLTAVVIPQEGFEHIIFNLVATEFVGG